MQKKLILILSCFLLFSCSEEEKINTVEPSLSNANPFQNERILIVLGKDYDDTLRFVKPLDDFLQLSNKAASVMVLRYEDMTRNIAGVRTKMILEKINEQKSTLVVSIGIPDKGGHYFIRAKEAYSNLRIISLLPMDDVLALEASCLMIVDFAPDATVLADAHNFTVSQAEAQTLFLASFLMLENTMQHSGHTLFFTEHLGHAFEQAAAKLQHSELESRYMIEPYVDPQTSIASHAYILLKKSCDVLGEQPL